MNIGKETFGEWLARVATIKTFYPDPSRELGAKGNEPMNYHASKVDDSFIDSLKDPAMAKMLFEMGTTEFIQSSQESKRTATIGFNPTEQKWYGWSHRAIFGFGIGSEVKKGNPAYQAKDKDDFTEQMINFWTEESHKNISADWVTNPDTKEEGVAIVYEYKDGHLEGTITSMFCPAPKVYGKGEWTANDLNDAKQMAIDFANGVG